jgi:hypothetical protein
MSSLDDLLSAAQRVLRDGHHDAQAAAVAAARNELKRLMKPMEDGYCHIELAVILSQRTKQGMVELTLNREKTQMDLDKAREVYGMLGTAIEAAVSDTLIYRFLTTKVGLSDEKASMALLDFRELRQGSRDTVFPQ